MADRHDYVALEWVKGEIEQTLTLARQALEGFVEESNDTTRLQFCVNYLHQVHRTLQMVEFFGAALLSEEMELLAIDILESTADMDEHALETLMQGIIQLPIYLDKVKSHQQDVPFILLPILNDIRAARHESLLSEGMLFQPHLMAAQPKLPSVGRQFDRNEFLGLVKKLRQMFQLALTGLLRGEEVKQNCQYLSKVLLRLIKECPKTPLSQSWKIALAFCEGLSNGSITVGKQKLCCDN